MRFLICVIGMAGITTLSALDTGAAGTWHWLQKLATTASLMHTTAHPDDEHGGMLALASRGMGARVSLLTLTRGEAGDNALGPQLFDALGLIRTEELAVSNRYYGVDQQYFTSVVDYGFSKRLEEAFDKWGRENVLRDVVRIIRTERPLVIVSRFQGNARDGHGNHQTAGLLTQQAFEAAADPKMFPEQIQAGLRPWQAKKLYIAGMRQNEPWTVVVDTGQYSPWLGESFENFARTGLSFQRSQNGGRLVRTQGPVISYYQRMDAGAIPGGREDGFFEGIDTTIPGIFRALGRPEPAGAAALLQPIDAAVQEAIRTFDGRDPSAIVPVLARGLAAARVAHRELNSDPDAALILARKIEQFQMAINTALGLELIAEAQPPDPADGAGSASPFRPPPVMGPVVPGQAFEVRVALARGSVVPIQETSVSLELDRGWRVESERNIISNLAGPSPSNQRPPTWSIFTVRAPADAPISTRPYFSRASIQDARYDIADDSQFGKPFTEAPPTAVVGYRVADVPVEVRAVVKRREAKLPYGYVMRELRVVPAVSLAVSPTTAVVPLASATRRVDIAVDVLNSSEAGSKGVLALRVPPGWKAEPAEAPFAFARAGERASFRFTVTMPSIENRLYDVRAVATVDGREYSEGFEEIDFRDLEARHLYRPSTIAVRGIDVATVPGLKVGYVMGIGDQVPQGIRQLGCEVTLLDERALATADLSQYDAIMTGTRAYAVRDDLKTYNQRLLDYARNGGHLIVLYNTQELVPSQFAPFPGELTPRAEEVSEEDSPVDILAPDAPMLNVPNRITPADFDGWVEQRGSKFWSAWDPAYTPVIATHDIGQDPQRGGWLWARVGKGHYTYFAYAFHRQLPYGVPGAYRLLANLLALGKSGR
ncbi:MAG: PIG-L family deacetylase [Acidobacteria bacterium]|nr:PIG-L family deacetylase [Acidobacteriota bacterium]